MIAIALQHLPLALRRESDAKQKFWVAA
jgi:hypothetical protein